MRHDDEHWPFAEAILEAAGGRADVEVDARRLTCAQNLDDKALTQTVHDLFAKGLLRKLYDPFRVKLKQSGVELVVAHQKWKESQALSQATDAGPAHEPDAAGSAEPGDEDE